MKVNEKELGNGPLKILWKILFCYSWGDAFLAYACLR